MPCSTHEAHVARLAQLELRAAKHGDQTDSLAIQMAQLKAEVSSDRRWVIGILSFVSIVISPTVSFILQRLAH